MPFCYRILKFGIDPARITSGIGFIGTGTIIAEQGKIVGITSAASLWVTAALGLTTGMCAYILAEISTLLVFLILTSKIILKKLFNLWQFRSSYR